jgi:hypothetical protein
MATSTLVQYLENTGTSVTTGAQVFLGRLVSARGQEETYLCETAITAGSLVAVDVTKMTADTSGGSTALFVTTADFNAVGTVQKVVVGVAKASITGTVTAPKEIAVVVKGVAVLVPVIAATPVGSPLCLDILGAAGSAQIAIQAATEGHVFGYALTSTLAAGFVTAYLV